MINATVKMFKNYANFKGRATRKEFWLGWLGAYILFFLVNFIFLLFYNTNRNEDIVQTFAGILFIIILIPMLSLEIRRLHDINKPGYFWFIRFIPLVGIILMLVFLCSPSVNQDNKY